MSSSNCRLLTESAIRAAAPGDVLREDRTPGLQLQVSARGTRSWVLKYRGARKGNGERVQRSMGLGQHPVVSIAEARRLAAQYRAQIAQGIDPLADREAAEAEAIAAARAAAAASVTLRDAAERFVADAKLGHYRRPDQVAWRLDRVAAVRLADGRTVGDLELRAVTRKVVREVLATLARQMAAGSANACVMAISRLWTWAVLEDNIEGLDGWLRPTSGVRLNPTVAGSRVLSNDELGAVMRAARALPWPDGPVVQLMVYTGARGGEIEGLVWDQDGTHGYFDRDANCLRFPEGSTKSGEPHTIYLSRQARAVLDGCPRSATGPFVFARNGDLRGRVRRNAKPKLDAVVAIPAWRLHDLRRTVATRLQDLGTPVEVIQAVLNHSAGPVRGVTAIYARGKYAEPLKAAWQRWADHVDTITSDNPAAQAAST